MRCDICGKSEATVHLTEIVDNKISKLHLCEECARKKGTEMEEHFGLSDLLAGLADFETHVTPKKEQKTKCPKCGMSYDDFKKTGRLGCGECYITFENNLVPLIKRIHGSTKHFGKGAVLVSKKPPKAQPAKKKSDKPEGDELDGLKNRLQSAIKLEEFEEAARLRDKIKNLEKKGQKQQ